MKSRSVLNFPPCLLNLTVTPIRFKPPGGFTWNLNITCLRPLPLPATVVIESQVIHRGSTMGLVRGAIMSQDRKKTYFVGEQSKVDAMALEIAKKAEIGAASKL